MRHLAVRLSLTLSMAVAVPLLATPVAEAAPERFSHQGRIADSTGVPVDGTHSVTLTLYDDPSGGNQLWTETTADVTFSDGYFSLQPGASTPIPASALTAPEVYVEIALDGGTPIGERQRLNSVPYALHANDAAHAAQADEADQAETARNVSGGIVDATEIRVNGTTVIDSSGALATSAAWSGLTGVPPDLADGDNDTTYTAGAGLILSGTEFSLDPAAIPAPTVSWSDLQGIPDELADGDDDTTYSAGAGLTLTGNSFAVADQFVRKAGDTMNKEYPTLIVDHPTPGGASGLRFNSRVNNGSDAGFLLFQDETSNSPGTSTEDVRLTLGVYNDFRQSAAHSDELWLQGGGRLVYNVGGWDTELNTLIGVPGTSAAVSHEWRANNTVAMTLSSAGVLNPVGGLACPTNMTAVAGGRICIDNANRPAATMHAAIGVCRALQARVCKHTDMQQACGVTSFNPYGNVAAGWYGDHARMETTGNTDDEFLTWNVASCANNNDGPARQWDAVLPYRCCL